MITNNTTPTQLAANFQVTELEPRLENGWAAEPSPGGSAPVGQELEHPIEHP